MNDEQEWKKPPLIIGIVLLLAAAGSGIAYAVVQLTREETGPPDLELKTKFPKGFDRYTTDVAAISFDGQARCRSAFNLDPAWGHKGIFSTKDEPTAKDILKANPVEMPGYGYVGTPMPSQVVDRVEHEQGTWCQYRYWAEAWQTQANVENTEPVELRDTTGTPFSYASTPVRLGGNGDGNSGSRFILTGTTPEELSIDYRVYPKGTTKAEDEMYRGFATALGTTNSEFTVVFDVPNVHMGSAELVLIPVKSDGVNVTAAINVSLTSLFRLETFEAQLVAGATSAPSGPAPASKDTWMGGRVYRGESLRDVGQQAQEDDLAGNLEAVSHAAFLVQQAFEPEASPGKAGYHQALPGGFRFGEQLRVDEASRGVQFDVTYTWTAIKGKGTFVAALTNTETRAVTQMAGATASISQVGSDGIAVLRAVEHGPTPQTALIAVHRGLSVTGHTYALDDALSHRRLVSTDLLATTQRFFLASGIAAVGYEWYEAAHADNLPEKVIHTVRASRIALETLFSLSPAGAILVAATNLVEYAVAQILPVGTIGQLENALRSGFGQVTDHGARQAFSNAAPHIEALAEKHEARFLAIDYDKPKETPFPWALTILGVVIALGALASIRGKR